jgi:flagellar basal-body rod protein FlgF
MSDSAKAIASSLEALTQQYRTITNNLANASTPGFKRTRTTFQQLLDNATSRAAPGESGGRLSPSNSIDFAQGVLTPTGRGLDLALEGDGFFVLETPDGPLYTRSGKFRTNGEGQLVDPVGRLVSGDSGPITVPPTASTMDLVVSRDGRVSVGSQSLGKLKVVTFADASQLTPVGGGCFQAARSATVRDVEGAVVHQGFFESSNVSVVEELVGLISVTRLYEANLKSISVQDDKTKSLMQVAMS